MGLEIAKIMDERELSGEDLLEDLIERIKKYEIKAVQDKRLIFTRVRTFLEKVFGSFYTTEKKEPMVLISQALVRLKQNPHLSKRDEKIKQVDRLLESLAENGLLRLRHGQSEERDFTIISQRLTVQLNGEEKQYEIRRKIPSAKKSADEEKDRLARYREELKVIEQIKITCKQIDGLISQPMEDEIKQEAARTVREYFGSLEEKIVYANNILTGKGFIEDSFIAQLKLESLDLAEELKDLNLVEKLVFLSSLNWYRNAWASRSFNEPDNLVFFMLSRMINRHAPWNPKGDKTVREALSTVGIPVHELEQKLMEQVSGSTEEAGSSGISVDRRKEKIFQLIRQIYQLRKLLTERKSVEDGNTLLKKFLRPGIRTEVSRSNMEIIAEEIRSQVKIESLNKYMRELSFDNEISGHVAHLRQALGEGSINLFQQLQAFRVAHGLSNLADNKEREKLAAFIAPMDVVQFLTQLTAGQITINKATDSDVEIVARGTTGETIDSSQRTLTNKGLTYDEAARYINKEFENLLFSYDKDDFEARCSDCNPGYEREKDHHVKIKQFAWMARSYPWLKFYFGGLVLLVSPIMHNLMEGEKEKEQKTIHEHTAKFMQRVAELEKYLIRRIREGVELFQVSELDRRRLDSQYTSGLRDTGDSGPVGAQGGGNYNLLLEEGVKELFPKVNFELQVLLQEAGDSGDDEDEDPEVRAERARTEEERAFDEKYSHLMIDSNYDPEAPAATGRKVNKRSVTQLGDSLENITTFFNLLRDEGYDRRVPVMRRDQIVSNIRSAGYFMRDIVSSLPEDRQDVANLMRKTDNVLQKSREALQCVEVIEEQVEVEKENVEVPLYELHSILVTLNSTYIVTLQGLVELIGQKHLSSRMGMVKTEQIAATKKLVDNIESVFNTLIRNSRSIKLESPKIATGLRDAMSMNIAAALGEINRLKRSQLIIQSCQHPNDLRIYLNVLARELLDRKLVVPLQNILGSLKKAPTMIQGGEEYAIWKPEGEERISASVFGKMDVPAITLNDVPKVLRTVIQISDQLADHLVARGEEFREKLKNSKQSVPEKTTFEDFAEHMTKNVSGALGQLHALFIPDKDNNITFDPERLEDILRIIGTAVGELLELTRQFNKNKAVFSKEIEALKRIAPVVESVRNCVNEYNANYLKQKRSADLARSQTNCDKTLIAFCQELQKFDDPMSLEYKILVIRGRVYVALESLVQRILGLSKMDFNAERRKKCQLLVNELFYMMSHVRTEERDLPLFRKFTESALRAAENCGNPTLAAEVKKMITLGEEMRDWLRLAESGFSEAVANQVYRPGMDVDRLRKLSEGI